MTQNRQQFVEKLKLREHINKLAQTTYQKVLKDKKKNFLQEHKLRQYLKFLIKEAKDTDIPEFNTGINILKELLKRVIPVLEVDYKSLTTNKIQRLSFRAHIINAVDRFLSLGGEKLTLPKKSDVQNIEEVDKTPEEKFIDISKKETPIHDVFTIPGEDTTGRNMALRSYDKIERNILDAYKLLGDETDKILFSDYLLTNLKLYFDRFEEELTSVVQEPTNQKYEDIKGEKEINKTAPIEEPAAAP